MENYKLTKRIENFIRLAVLSLVVLVCVAVFSFVRLGKVRRENEKYEQLIAELKIESSKVNISASEKTNPEYLEKEVRDRLGMVKGDETYIEFK